MAAAPGVSPELITVTIVLAAQIVCIPIGLATHDYIAVTQDTAIAALCARIIWAWWRRRRKGKPSRVLGLVKDLGHKLGVVAIPAEVGQ